MIGKLALYLTDVICTEEFNNPKDRAKIEYGLSVLIGEGFKIILLLLLFYILQRQYYFLFSFIIIVTIRTFSGGIHLRNTFSCILATIPIFIFTCVFAPSLSKLNILIYISIIVYSLLSVALLAPKCNPRRPIKNDRRNKLFRRVSFFSTLAWCFWLILLKDYSYINCGFFTLLIQNLQLLPLKDLNFIVKSKRR